MKILFLLFGIVASTAVHAQQKELFNIEEHLQKKMAEAFTLPAPPQPVVPVKIQSVTPVLPVQPFTYTLTNKDVVHYGNGTMPCVKPDSNQFPNLANAGDTGKDMLLNGPMPNGAMRNK